MKLLTSLTISDQTRTCQVSAELELDNQVTPEVVSTRTSELLLGLQSGITNAVSGSTLKNVTPSANPPALVEAGPNENATQVTNPPALVAAAPNNNVVPGNQETWQTAPVAPKRKQRPGGLASEKQLKYLNDLLALNGLNLAVWCKEKGVPKDQIRAVHCQQWIPELKDRQKNNGWPT